MLVNYQNRKVKVNMKKIKGIGLILFVVILAVIYSYGNWPRAIYDTSIGSSTYETTETLNNKSSVEQKFRCEDEGFSGVTIKLTKQGNNAIGDYQWVIEDVKSEKVIGKGVINEKSTENADFESSNIQKQGIVELDFPRVENSKGREYALKINALEVEDNHAIAIFITEKGEGESSLIVNGQEIEKASVIKLEYRRFNVETFVVFLAIVAYLLLFVKFMYKLFR